MGVFGNRALMRIFGPKRDEVTRERRVQGFGVKTLVKEITGENQPQMGGEY
jgi:hypothetical protein